MKRIISFFFLYLLLTITCPVHANAQGLPLDTLGRNKDMKRFYEGCLKIREGERTGDLAAYEDAMILLNTFRGGSNDALNLVPLNIIAIDTLAELPIAGHVEFTRAYAKAKARQEPYKAEDILREFGRCRVKMLAIEPESTVVYADEVWGDCLMLAISGEPEAKVSLSVIETSNDEERQASPFEDSAVAFIHWRMKEKGMVKYMIQNPTNQIISVALVSN